MAIDWIATLREQGDIAKRLAKDVPMALSDTSLTLDQASRLNGIVENGSKAFDRIVVDMQEHDLDASLFEAADALENIWCELSVATANKVRSMQGLTPIGRVRPEYDDEY